MLSTYYSPNHLRLRYNELPGHRMALIASGLCVLQDIMHEQLLLKNTINGALDDGALWSLCCLAAHVLQRCLLPCWGP